MKRLLLGRKGQPAAEPIDMRLEAARGRVLVEESRELVIVLDEQQRVVACSRRARESLQGLVEGGALPEGLVRASGGRTPLAIPYEVDGHRETLLYVGEPHGQAAYEELRAGFTAAVSHELRTPLARLLALLETALLPASEPVELIEQARSEVQQIGELIDDVLFLSELETGRQVVALGSTPPLPVLEEVVAGFGESAARSEMIFRVEAEPEIEVPLRQRMLRVVVENLVGNAIRYAGPGTTCTVSVRREGEDVVLRVADDGAGVDEQDLPRLFERFYRADRARASRGTGLGLAIVKHVVTAAGGRVEASGGPGRGLGIRCSFPAS